MCICTCCGGSLPSQIPLSSEHYTGEGALALPKLNLQFLTINDYLLRNFSLFRCAGAGGVEKTAWLGVERTEVKQGNEPAVGER